MFIMWWNEIGLAHAASGETATLLKLSETNDADTKLSYEYGHVVYFPNLLLHAVYDHIKGKGNSLTVQKKEKEKEKEEEKNKSK